VSGPDAWLLEFAAKKKAEEKRVRRQMLLKSRAKLERRLQELRNSNGDRGRGNSRGQSCSERSKKKQKVRGERDGSAVASGVGAVLSGASAVALEEEKFAPADYHSADEGAGGGKGVAHDGSSSSSDSDGGEGLEADAGILGVKRVIYCSRTHSQISQFVNEVKKTTFGKLGKSLIKCVVLGSRKTLCVNPAVKKLKHDSRISEKCLDLQQEAQKQKQKKQTKRPSGGRGRGRGGGGPSKTSCQYHDHASQKLYRDHVLAQVQDIEEVAALGTKMACCGYYGTRAALPFADLIALPYSTLLSKSAREAVGLDLRGRCVDHLHIYRSPHTCVHLRAV
jgi:chromosome transmission fidelity protein 1